MGKLFLKKASSSLLSYFLLLTFLCSASSFAKREEGPRLTQYKIEEIRKNFFHIKNDEKFVSLELIPGDGSLIKINDVPFSLELEKPRRHNEKIVAKRLENIFYFKDGDRELSKGSWKEFFFPSARATEWLAEGNGSDGLARIILSIVYMNRKETRKLRKEDIEEPSALSSKK